MLIGNPSISPRATVEETTVRTGSANGAGAFTWTVAPGASTWVRVKSAVVPLPTMIVTGAPVVTLTKAGASALTAYAPGDNPAMA